MVKNIFKTAFLLFILQMLRILFKSVIFLFVERTLMTDVSVNCIYTFLAILLSLYIFKSKNINIDFLPKDFNVKYKAATTALLIFMITTPVITKSIALYSIISLVYNALLTVIYEEIIFRGYIYKDADIKKHPICLCIFFDIFWIMASGIYRYDFVEDFSFLYRSRYSVNYVLESSHRVNNRINSRIFQIQE